MHEALGSNPPPELHKPAMVLCAYNLCTWGAEAEESEVKDIPHLHSESKAWAV